MVGLRVSGMVGVERNLLGRNGQLVRGCLG